MQTVKVKNTQARLLQVTDPVTKKVRTLKPGVNLVEPHIVEAARKVAVFETWVREGWLEIEAAPVDAKVARDLSGMKVTEAVKLVTETYDVEQLVAWKSSANLAARVLAAIDNQIAAIDATRPEA